MRVEGAGPVAVDAGFAAEIRKRSGENVYLCYQCRKCASGCPARDFMDATPAQLMRFAQLGLTEKCMKGNTVWYCSSCQTCSTRCPAGIDIAHVVDTIKIIAQERGVGADTKGAGLFNSIWMRMLKYTGRIYEVGLAGMLNTLRGNPMKDAGLGAKLFARGKMNPVPSITRPLEMMRMFSRAKKVRR